MSPKPLRTLIALRSHGRRREAIDRFREERLRSVLRHAYERVPYYRSLFDGAGIRPEDIASPADLRHVPITTRDTLQQLGAEEIVARGVDPSRLLASSSSGSSGRPITIRRTWAEARLLATIRVRAFRDFGLRSRDTVVGVRTPSVTKHADLGLASRVLATLRRDRWQVVDSGLPAEAIVDRVAALGADVLNGYPGQLALLTTEVDPARLRALGLRFVTAGGEVLYPSQRDQIADAFGVPLYETYASTEFDVLGAQCPHAKSQDGERILHVMDDGVLLDLEGEEADDPSGEVVGTCLHSYAMPLIRYAQGDVALRGGACGCGRAWSTLRTVQGRMLDFFVTPDGAWIHPYEIFVPIRERCPWIRRFQAIQRTASDVTLRVEAARPPTPEEVATARAVFAERFSPRSELTVELVTRFDAGPGKFQQYRSLVRSQPARDDGAVS